MQIKKIISSASSKLSYILQKLQTLHRKTIFFSILGLGIFVFLIVILISLPGGSRKINAFKAIPENAGMIIEIKKPLEFWASCSENSAIWQQLIQFDFFSNINRNAIFIDSLVNTNISLSESLNKNPLYISFHNNNKSGTSCLFVGAIPSEINKKETENIVSNYGKSGTISSRNFEHFSIYELLGKKGTSSFFYYLTGGLFIGSTDTDLIEKSIKQVNSSKSISDLQSFKNVYQTSGKNVSANIYINHNNFAQLLAQLTDKGSQNEILKLNTFAQWSALDLTLKEQLLLFNGYSCFNDTIGNDFLSTFKGQLPHETTIQKIIPASTVFMICYGFSDFQQWNKNYLLYLNKIKSSDQRKKSISVVNSLADTDIEKQLLPCIGNELALVITAPDKNDTAANYYGIFKTSQLEKTLALLKPEKMKISVKQEQKVTQPKKKGKKKKQQAAKTITVTKTEEIENIYEYKGTGALQALFGNIFQKVSCNYYSIVGDYVVFSNSTKSLKQFLEADKSNNTLSENSNYNLFSKNISEESNIFIYTDISKASLYLSSYSDKNIQNARLEKPQIFEKFDAMAFQLKCDGKLFYNNACLTINALAEALTNQLWTAKLDTLMLFGPQSVNATDGSGKSIVAFDQSNQFYIIDNKGSILHKLQFSEIPLTVPVEINMNVKGKKQYVFNTPSYLYIIDSDGFAEPGFPIKFEKTSTAAMTVADYSGNNDYRFLIPCGKQLYNYTKKGTLNSGWTLVNTKSDIIKKPEVISFAGGDCIVITDKDGLMTVVDRKGIEKIKLKEAVKVSFFSKIYMAKMPSTKGKCMLTTDYSGKLIFIDEKGKMETAVLGNFSASHQFLYEDFNADGTKDFIFLDSNKIVVYNEKHALIASLNFPYPIASDLVIMKKAGKKAIVGAYSVSAQKIYIITPDGLIKEGFPLRGNTSFFIESLHNNSELNLVVGFGKSVINYSFK